MAEPDFKMVAHNNGRAPCYYTLAKFLTPNSTPQFQKTMVQCFTIYMSILVMRPSVVVSFYDRGTS